MRKYRVITASGSEPQIPSFAEEDLYDQLLQKITDGSVTKIDFSDAKNKPSKEFINKFFLALENRAKKISNSSSFVTFLDKISIPDLELKKEEVGCFISVLRYFGVRDFNISGNAINCLGMSIIVNELTHSDRVIEYLNLKNNSITYSASHIRVISKLCECKIKKLDLSCNQLGDYFINDFASFFQKEGSKIKDNLELIDLNQCNLTDESIDSIIKIIKAGKIKSIYLSGNKIGDHGAVKIIDAAVECGIESIYLRDCNLGKMFAEKISSLPQSENRIKLIDFADNPTIGESDMVKIIHGIIDKFEIDKPFLRPRLIFRNCTGKDNSQDDLKCLKDIVSRYGQEERFIINRRSSIHNSQSLNDIPTDSDSINSVNELHLSDIRSAEQVIPSTEQGFANRLELRRSKSTPSSSEENDDPYAGKFYMH